MLEEHGREGVTWIGHRGETPVVIASAAPRSFAAGK